MLEEYVRNLRKQKDILLMTHIVLGYPSFEDSFKIVEAMVNAGVDMMELQIPFSEPIADGPVILRANQKALERGATVEKCIDFSKTVCRNFDVPFLFMTYYNIAYQYGVDRFADAMREAGLYGSIIPDLPPEEGDLYLSAMKRNQLSPVFIFSPTTSLERMKYLASFARGFIYCVARKGVTGSETDFSESLAKYLTLCRSATDLPLALGFGVKNKTDVDFIKDRADIAVIGSETIRVIDKKGVRAVGDFIKNLR
ncbi:MAG: tryptophan synthase subunit alpha [Deltaproteobacteria bacterium]|nr:tryptophan synthase subunit alpha [Deltaproteobacteria bacterium]MBW2150565.1 tryptophan synthase subunit alpha [Deltaproteobacteria bacterium]